MNLLSSDQGVGTRVRAEASASYGLPVYVMLLVEGVVAAVLVGGAREGGWVVIVDVVVVVCIAVEVEEFDEEEVGCLNLLDVQ